MAWQTLTAADTVLPDRTQALYLHNSATIVLGGASQAYDGAGPITGELSGVSCTIVGNILALVAEG